MKKLSLILAALATVTNGFAQGTVFFYNNITTVVTTRVYMPTPGNDSIQKYGNTATDTPPGTQTYVGALVDGNGFTAQIWSAPGANQPESSLVGQTTTTFRTGAAAGIFADAITATLSNVLPDAPVATLQIRVFATQYGSWAAANAASQIFPYGQPLGASLLFNVDNIGGTINTPPNLVGLTSFSLFRVIPEPSSTAFGGLGAAAMLLRRKRAGR